MINITVWRDRMRFLLLLLLWGFVSANGLWHTTFCVLTAPREVSYLSLVLHSLHEQNAHRVGLMLVNASNHDDECNTNEPLIEGVPSCRVRRRSLSSR
jgi:hypothetical protein